MDRQQMSERTKSFVGDPSGKVLARESGWQDDRGSVTSVRHVDRRELQGSSPGRDKETFYFHSHYRIERSRWNFLLVGIVEGIGNNKATIIGGIEYGVERISGKHLGKRKDG